MKFSNFILTMATLFTAESVIAAGLDSRNNPVFTPGSTADLMISADLSSETSALQFTVTLPEVFELGSENLVFDNVVAATLQTRVHKENDNTYNYVLYTADNTPIDTSGDYLFSLSLNAKSTSVGGSYALRFSNIINATPSGKETSLSDYSATLRIYIPTESITLSQQSASLKVGESVTLSATVLPEDATDKTVTWTSSNETVAKVNADGKVTALALGEAEITAECGEVSATCKITVVPTPVESITLSQQSAQLKVGESLTLTATVLPEDATDKTLTWISTNETVSKVNADGKVTALALGEAVITAECGEVSATCKITVVPTPVESITLSQTTAQLKVGESVTLTATVLPEDATDKTVTWTSSKETVAKVNSDGKITAIALGEAVITAKCGEVSATCKIIVIPTPVESITLNYNNKEITEGETFQLKATVLPENATNKEVVWSSSNTEIATVAEDGTFIALKPGNVEITATAVDGSGVKATCNVIVIAKIILAESLIIDPVKWTGEIGDSFRITATISPENTTDKTLSWSSTDNTVATVDNSGTVTLVGVGVCNITACTNDGSNLKANCSVETKVSGVTTVTEESESSIDIFTYNGLILKRSCKIEEVKSLSPGIYIIRQGPTYRKVVIK